MTHARPLGSALYVLYVNSPHTRKHEHTTVAHVCVPDSVYSSTQHTPTHTKTRTYEVFQLTTLSLSLSLSHTHTHT